MAAKFKISGEEFELGNAHGSSGWHFAMNAGTKLTMHPFITGIRDLSTWLTIESNELATEKPWLPGYYFKPTQTS